MTSPRDSPSLRSASSSQTSLELPAGPRPPADNQRRNRAALRDYYNLKLSSAQAPDQVSPVDTTQRLRSPTSELDREGFDPSAYVQALLSSSSLEAVLRAEGSLIGEIKTLDGERKALVYDNYSKLIAATDTIRRMRTNMDPLTPATSTLSPAVSHIADTAASLSRELRERTANAQTDGDGQGAEGDNRQAAERQTVRWVLATPQRIQEQLKLGSKASAEAEFESVKPLLDRWHGVAGTAELRGRCESMLLNG